MNYLNMDAIRAMWATKRQAVLDEKGTLTGVQAAKKHGVRESYVYSIWSRYAPKVPKD